VTDAELAQHWQTLHECERHGVKPRTLRALLEEIERLRNELTAREEAFVRVLDSRPKA
jgi:hypothetical protein